MMDVTGEWEAVRVVEELREFIEATDESETRPGSRIAQERALARLAINAYEEARPSDLDTLAPIARDSAR